MSQTRWEQEGLAHTLLMANGGGGGQNILDLERRGRGTHSPILSERKERLRTEYRQF